MTKGTYPVVFEVEYPEHCSRLLALLGALFSVKVILLIPHIVILYALVLIQAIVIYIGYWAVLITGRYPRGLFNFGVGVERWNIRATAWANGWTDSYPPFSLSGPASTAGVPTPGVGGDFEPSQKPR